MSNLTEIPVFRSDNYDALGAYLIARIPSGDPTALVCDPSSADELPGREVRLHDEPLCRVIPDPSDPRPLSLVLRRCMESATAALPG